MGRRARLEKEAKAKTRTATQKLGETGDLNQIDDRQVVAHLAKQAYRKSNMGAGFLTVKVGGEGYIATATDGQITETATDQDKETAKSKAARQYLERNPPGARSEAASRLRDHFIKVLEDRQQADEALCAAAIQLDVSITWHLGPFLNGFQQADVYLQRPLPDELRNSGLTANLQFARGGNQRLAEEDLEIGCVCHTDSSDPCRVSCEFRKKNPSAVQMAQSLVTFAPCAPDADFLRQKLALEVHASPHKEGLAEAVRDLVDSWEQAVFGDRLPGAKELEASHFAPGHQVLRLFNQGLNKEQTDAVRQAATSPVSFIWGPPGTGKTQVAAHLACTHKASLPPGQQKSNKVLMVAPSNVAADQLALQADRAAYLAFCTGATAQKLKVVRYQGASKVAAPEIVAHGLSLPQMALAFAETHQGARAPVGKEAIVADLLKLAKTKASGRNFRCEDQVLLNRHAHGLAWDVVRDSDIICCTASTAGNGTLSSVSCHVIIDEAGMINLPMALVPIYLTGAKKVTFVGDPKQLPPFLDKGEDKSLGLDPFTALERSVNGAILRPCMLVRQYRMLDPIPGFPSAKWYRNELRTYHNPLTPYLFGAVKLIRLTGSIEVAEGKSWHNPKELQEMLKDVRAEVLTCGDSKLSVILPYRAQTAAMEAAVRMDPALDGKVRVSTIDSFQGSEADIIFLGLVRTQESGFLKDEHRMNVALTRAKRSLYVYAAKGMLENFKLGKELLEFYCKGVSSGLTGYAIVERFCQ